MHCSLRAAALLALSITASMADARPYPGISGLAATADSATTAGTNPAGITRFKQRAFDAEVIWFTSDSKWQSEFSESGQQFNSYDSGDTVIPRVAYVQPINDRWAFSFTFLGTGFSDDLGEWPGRYFITEYESIYVSAFPSLAYRINDQWSVAGSLAVTYTNFEQERAIRNTLDPGFGDGKSELEADSIEFGFGASALYEYSERTRFGLTYQSEIEPDRDADASYSNLGPNTESRMESLGIFDADITLESTSPQSALLGVYHEFTNDHAVTVDLAWVDFSEFTLSEYYFNGNALAESSPEYDDIYAVAVSYTFPVSQRWMLGVGGAMTSDMVDDEDRTMTLRIDEIWTLGVAAEWQWTDSRSLRASVAYIGMDDGPVETPRIPQVGSLQGEYESRDIWQFQIGMSWGGL